MRQRGWTSVEKGWQHERTLDEVYPRTRALHHQLTFDLTQALARWQWRVVGYSQRGYAQLEDGVTGESHALPSALRVEARRQGQPVRDFTYALFLAAAVSDDP